MARTNTRLPTSKYPPENQQQNHQEQYSQVEEEISFSSEEEEDPSAPLLPLLISTISQSLHFLSSNDLLLSPSHSLALSSLLSHSAHSLSSFASSHNNLINNYASINLRSDDDGDHDKPDATFPWFRRFLNSPSSSFSSHFHLSKPTFYLLLQTITPSLNSISTTPFPPDVKLAAFLFRLSHAAPFSFVSRRFFSASSPSVACRSFYEVCKSLIHSLSHLFELSTDTKRVVEGFNWMSLRNCCGVLSFFRVPVSGHLRGGSVVGQFVVDSEGRFLDLSVGWHGSMTPDLILPRTKLYSIHDSALQKGKCYFIGGSCCPLLHWLLTPYAKVDNMKKEMFNAVHGKGMELAERAVKRLRGRWKLMTMEWKEDCVEALPYVVVASCLLHNYFIKCSEAVVEDKMDGVGMELGFKVFQGKWDEKGKRKRDWLATQLTLR